MFDKYPKVPNQQKNDLQPSFYTVQEKLDGANAGLQLVQRNGPRSILVHNRNQALAEIFLTEEGPVIELHQSQLGAFHELVTQVRDNLQAIIAYMFNNSYVHVYGEWLVKHTVEYPADMWKHFYPFDAVNTDGKFVKIERNSDYPEVFGELLSMSVAVAEGESQSTFVRETTKLIEEGVARRIEGTVWKRYDMDAEGKLDEYGQRYCYKDVLPEFREDHANNPMFPDRAAVEPLAPHEKVVAHMPDRALEKVYQKLTTFTLGWNNKLFEQYIGLVWQEFLEEWFGPALVKNKMPKIDTGAMYKLVASRAREFALEHSNK